MPKQERIKTKYPGVYYIVKGSEKVFYIYYRINGKQIEEKAGRQFADDMTPARAAGIRADREEGKQLSNNARRDKIKKAKATEAGKMTISRLWDTYEENKDRSKGFRTDESRFNKHLLPAFGNKQPHDIIRLDTDRLRVLLLKDYKPQTIKHVFGLLKRIINFGVSRQLCGNLNFKIEFLSKDLLYKRILSLKVKSKLMSN
jgi:hypothetical protein